MIDILVPVLSRPQNAAPLVESIHSATTVPYRILFLCSPQDEAQIEACMATGSDFAIMKFPAGRADYARKMQEGYEVTDSPWLFLGADDIVFSAGWDQEVLAQGKAVVGTNDMANASVRKGFFGTHCLVERRYVTEEGASADGPGSLFHLGYDHNFVDRELCGVAQSRGQWAFAKRAVVRHLHPLWGTAPDDDTYRKSLRRFHEDQRLFWKRASLWEYAGLSEAELRHVRGRRPRVAI